MDGLFNKRKHSDCVVEVTGHLGADAFKTAADDGVGQSQAFYLHKFPLIAKSGFFHDYFEQLDDIAEAKQSGEGASDEAGSGTTYVKLDNFPGGPTSFEALGRYCYGEPIDVTVETLAYLYCGSRFLRLREIVRDTETFLTEKVLRDPAASAIVLSASTHIEDQPEDILVNLVGRCINTLASQLHPMPELSKLSPDCFSCVVRTALEMGAPKSMLQDVVAAYCESRIDPTPAPSRLTPAQFHEVVIAPGVFDDMPYADSVFRMLEILLGEISSDDGVALCAKLGEVGFWGCLPHAAIERAYTNKAVPDRFVTVALMTENRHLLKINDELADEVEELTALLAKNGIDVPDSIGAAAGSGGAGSADAKEPAPGSSGSPLKLHDGKA